MATIVGGISVTHVPYIGRAIAGNLQQDAYCAKYGLNKQQREAIRNRNVLQLIEAGGNAYYLAKFAGIFGLDMQDIGA